MFPGRDQFRRWSYPSKFSFVSFFMGLAIAITFWLFPDGGKHLVEIFVDEAKLTSQVPGQNYIERQINLAKIEGISTTTPSSQVAVVIPFARPSLTQEVLPHGFSGNMVALSNVSPIYSENQDIVFAAGRCRLLGFVTWRYPPELVGEASIKSISCVLDNRDSYEIGESEGAEIGFLAQLSQPTNREVKLVKESKSITLPKDGRYLVQFSNPLHDFKFRGKSAISW